MRHLQNHTSTRRKPIPVSKRQLESVGEYFLNERRLGSPVKFEKSILGLSPDELGLMALEAEEVLAESVQVPFSVREQLAHLALQERVFARLHALPEYAEFVAGRYAYALGKAAGTFARLLTLAVSASRRSKVLSVKQNLTIWSVSTISVQPFCQWNYAKFLVFEACGTDSVLRDDFGKLFDSSLEGWFHVWLEAADRQIRIACLLSGITGESRVSMDPAKRTIAYLKSAHPGISQTDICARLDALQDRDAKLTPPRSWAMRSWTEAYGDKAKTRRLVKAYLSKIPSL